MWVQFPPSVYIVYWTVYWGTSTDENIRNPFFQAQNLMLYHTNEKINHKAELLIVFLFWLVDKYIRK